MKKAISLFLALIMCLSLCACGKSEAVKETEQAIKAIGKVTMSSQDAIEEASNLFDALTSEEQAKVSNRNDLSKAKDEFQSLVDYYIEIADRIVSAYTPQLGGAYKFTGEYLEDEKTYVVGVIFAIVPPESYRANSVDRISFGADYYTEQYNATRVAVDNTAVTANNLREIGQAQAHYFGFFFITIGALTILHYGKSYFTCDCIVSTFAENPQKAEQQIKCPPPTGEADFES